jgi:uncharacterized protein
MGKDLRAALETLKAHEADLRSRGVRHAAVFGSVARGQALPTRDIDVLVDLNPDNPIGVFEYARLKLCTNELFETALDFVNHRTLKPLLRDAILREAVDPF